MEIEIHEKQRPATLKRLKRDDDNELKRNLRLEKVVAGKQLRLAVETEEERRTRLENDAVILCLSFKLDVLTKHRHPQLKSCIIVSLSHSSLYVPNNLYLINKKHNH